MKGRAFLEILLIILVMLFLSVSLDNSMNSPHAPVIVAIGDSLTEGAGDDDPPYPVQLGDMLGARIINKGVGGDTTTKMCARFDSVGPLHPDYVVIMGGHNDLGRDGAARTIANLQEMYHRALQNNSKVVALTITPYYEYPEDLQIVNSWILGQRDPNIIPIDTFSPLTLNGTHLLNPIYSIGDFIHLNKEGHRVIANELFMTVFHGTPCGSGHSKDHVVSNVLFAVGYMMASFAVTITVIYNDRRW